MRKKRSDVAKTAQRRLQVEARLAEFPQLPADQIIDIVHWFKREATPGEVAAIASNPRIINKYRQFRRVYLNRLSAGELILGVGLGALLIVTASVIAAIA
ncbi:MAG: hypothetical protein EOP21_00885 [Hyphomicrobiales bacterium]|nr:MAG: hypothetical protein EOP21_00885 [Hyphomicrobiales bacterium]